MSPSKRDAFVVIALHAVAGFLFLSPSYVRPDSIGVMSWLRSAAIDGDFLFFNEWAGFGMLGNGFAWFKEVTPVGALANHWWVGTSILTAPFWGLSHLISIALPGPFFPDDGFFGLDLAMLGWTSVLFGALAAIAAVFMIREVAPSTRGREIAIAVICTSLGTPIFWYVFRTPIGTHAAGMMVVGAIAFHCWRLLSRPDWESPLLLGLLFGLAVVTRLQHALLFPAILLAGVRSRRSPRFYSIFALGAMLPIAVQAVAWHAVYGTPLGPLARGANLEGVTWMPFRSVELMPVLFSSWHGLFSWSPIVLVAIAGWLFMYREGAAQRDLSIVFGLMFAGELLANVALDRYWWGGMSFGARRFVDLAVPFAVGIAAAFRSRARLGALVTSVVAVAWSIALMLAATTGALSLNLYVTAKELLISISRVPETVAFSQLHSPIGDIALASRSAIAVALIALAGWIWVFVSRGRPALSDRPLLALLASSLLAALLLVSPTRARAPRELERLGMTGEAARSAGALLDQRALLEHEASWLRVRGDLARLESTRAEIEAISARLRELRVER